MKSQLRNLLLSLYHSQQLQDHNFGESLLNVSIRQLFTHGRCSFSPPSKERGATQLPGTGEQAAWSLGRAVEARPRLVTPSRQRQTQRRGRKAGVRAQVHRNEGRGVHARSACMGGRKGGEKQGHN